MVLRELAGVTVEPLSIIWGGSGWLEEGKCYTVFKKGKEEDPENNWLVSLLTAPGKIKEQVVIKVISRQNDGQENDWE